MDRHASGVFLMIRLGLCVLGRKITDVKCHFQHVISWVHIINMLTVDADLDHLVDIVLAGFLHATVTPVMSLSEGSHHAQPTLKE